MHRNIIYYPAASMPMRELLSLDNIFPDAFTGWLQRVRHTGEFSDVLVVVDGQEFHLHMLPLLNASTYFRSLPSSSNVLSPSAACHNSGRCIVLDGLPGGAEAFSIAADFCYLLQPTFTLQNLGLIRAAAEFLGMSELLESTQKCLHLTIFSHWRSCIAFLRDCGEDADEYVVSRCLKVVSAACAKAFFDTKNLSAPIENTWQSSPSQGLTDILVSTCSLRDEFVREIIEELVAADVNLNVKCRQGRNVKGWIDSTLTSSRHTGIADQETETKMVCRTRCWVLICLVRMLEKTVASERPWLELSSQYWCTLLQQACRCIKEAHHRQLTELRDRLLPVIAFLEQRIGASLHELDDYLLSYAFEPRVLLSMVGHFRMQMMVEEFGDKELEEVAAEVDSCLWGMVTEAMVSPTDLAFLIQSFPPVARPSHDLIYAAIEKLFNSRQKAFNEEEKRSLWRLVDASKLGVAFAEKAFNNRYMHGNDQPQVVRECSLLQKGSMELQVVKSGGNNIISMPTDDIMEGIAALGVLEQLDATASPETGQLRDIMQKVLKASLKLLEENTRRSMEITEIRDRYTQLIQRGGGGAAAELHESSNSRITLPVTSTYKSKQRHVATPYEAAKAPVPSASAAASFVQAAARQGYAGSTSTDHHQQYYYQVPHVMSAMAKQRPTTGDAGAGGHDQCMSCFSSRSTSSRSTTTTAEEVEIWQSEVPARGSVCSSIEL